MFVVVCNLMLFTVICSPYFLVRYEDGDREELNEEQVRNISVSLLRTEDSFCCANTTTGNDTFCTDATVVVVHTPPSSHSTSQLSEGEDSQLSPPKERNPHTEWRTAILKRMSAINNCLEDEMTEKETNSYSSDDDMTVVEGGAALAPAVVVHQSPPWHVSRNNGLKGVFFGVIFEDKKHV